MGIIIVWYDSEDDRMAINYSDTEVIKTALDDLGRVIGHNVPVLADEWDWREFTKGFKLPTAISEEVSIITHAEEENDYLYIQTADNPSFIAVIVNLDKSIKDRLTIIPGRYLLTQVIPNATYLIGYCNEGIPNYKMKVWDCDRREEVYGPWSEYLPEAIVNWKDMKSIQDLKQTKIWTMRYSGPKTFVSKSCINEEKDEPINFYENFEKVNEDDYYQSMEGMIDWIIKEHLKELVTEYIKLTKGGIDNKKLKRAIARLLNKISKPTSEEIIAMLKGSDLYGMIIKLPREVEKRFSKAKRLIKGIKFLIERGDVGEIENLLESEGLDTKQIEKIKLLIEKDDMVEIENILLNMKEN